MRKWSVIQVVLVLILMLGMGGVNLLEANESTDKDSLAIAKQKLIEKMLQKTETYTKVDNFPKKLDNLTKEGKSEYYYHYGYLPESFESSDYVFNKTDAAVTWGRVGEGDYSPVIFPNANSGSYQLYCAGVGYLNDGTTPLYENNMGVYANYKYWCNDNSELNNAASTVNLRFSYNIPSIDGALVGWQDYFEVIIYYEDGDEVSLFKTDDPTSGYVSKVINITPYIDSRLFGIAFYFDSDWGNREEGVYVDDFSITYIPSIGIPNLYSPYEDSVIFESPAFIWYPVSGVTGYVLVYDNNPYFSSPEVYACPESAFAPDAPLNSDKYYWYVFSRYYNVFSDDSDIWNFTLSEEVELYEPDNGVTISDRTPKFEWNEITGSDYYQIFCLNENDEFVIDESEWSSNYYQQETDLPDGTYRWMVRARYSVGWGEYSDPWTFTIGDATSLTITSPNGGEVWMHGTSHTITWDDPTSDNVEISIHSDFQGEVFSTVIDNSASNNGIYNWTVPSTIPPCAHYYLEINNGSASDYSEYNFCISNTSTVDIIGQWNIIAVWWKNKAIVEFFSNNTFQSVDGEVSGTWELTGNGLRFDFNNSDTYYLGVVTDNNNMRGSMVDPVYPGEGYWWAERISTESVTVTSPNGGEVWMHGTNHNITWNDDFDEDVKIELYKNGSLKETIISSTSSDGLYPWSITSDLTPGADYKIKVTSLENSSLYDETEYYFCISNTNTVNIIGSWSFVSSNDKTGITFEFMSDNTFYIRENPSVTGTWEMIGNGIRLLVDSYMYYYYIGTVEGDYMSGKGFDISDNPDYGTVNWSATKTTGIEEMNLPEVTHLHQNYPNPFNPETTITFDIAQAGNVSLNVYNYKGELVNTLVNEPKNIGQYSVNWNGKNNKGSLVNTGMYFIALQTENYSKVIKALMVK